MTKVPQVSKPAGLCKLTKVFIVSFKYVPSESNADSECLISQPQGSSRCIWEVPVSSNEVEPIFKVVNIQIKIAEATILFGELTYFSSHLPVAVGRSQWREMKWNRSPRLSIFRSKYPRPPYFLGS